MKLGKYPFALPAEKPKEPAKAPVTSAAAVIDEYLRQYPHGIPIGRSLVGLEALTLGQPIQLAPKIEFHPLLGSGFVANALAGNSLLGNGLLNKGLPGSSLAANSLLGNASLYKSPLSDPAQLTRDLATSTIALDPASELIAIAKEAMEARSVGKALWCAADFAEALPDLPRGVDIAVHALGVLKLTPYIVGTFRKRGNILEKGAILTHLAGTVVSFLTACPGLEHGKPVAEALGLVIKVGEIICTVPIQFKAAAPAKL
jgi:hypothetical protein